MCQSLNSVRLETVRLLKKITRSRTEWTVTRPYSGSRGDQLENSPSRTELYGVGRDIQSTLGGKK
jgi:hypothetical protein